MPYDRDYVQYRFASTETDQAKDRHRSSAFRSIHFAGCRRTEHLQNIALQEANIPYDTSSCTMDHETSTKQRGPALSTNLQLVDTLKQLCLEEMAEEEKGSYVFNEHRLVTEPGRLSLHVGLALSSITK
jgi:hypothetical protein